MNMNRAMLLLCWGVLAASGLSGCGVQMPATSTLAAVSGVGGQVHGGQQPVAGATIQLYSVGTNADGSTATPLLTQTVKSDANGNFTLTGLYSCASATQVYITATGGNPGLSAVNPNLAMMTALGACSGLGPSTVISINELTTVAAVFALHPYMSGPSAVGSASGDAAQLAQAMALAAEFVDPAKGIAPGVTLPAGVTAPVSLLNTLGNVLAACVNSTGGAANDGTRCGSLFALAPATNGTMPADTITALLNIANNPTSNTSSLVAMTSAISPFQPGVASAPADLTPLLSAPGTLTVTPEVLTFADTVVNATSGAQSVTVSNNSGAPAYFTSYFSYGSTGNEFAVVYPQTTCLTGKVDPGSSCTLAFTFTPNAVGAQQATTPIGQPTLASTPIMTLRGNGLAASGGLVSLSQTALTVMQSAITQLHNYSQNAVTVGSITVQGSGFSQTNDCPVTLPFLGFCTITVAAVTYGSQSATLSVYTTAAIAPLAATLTSNQPDSVSPTAINAGATPVGQTSVANVPVSYYNTGNSNGGNTFISGPNASEFKSGSNCLFRSNGESCTVTFYFTPAATGWRYATATIGNSLTVALRGLGGSSNPQFSLTTMVAPSSPSTNQVTVTNTGGANLSLTYVLSGANAAQFSLSTNCPNSTQSLYPQVSCVVSVQGDGSANATATLTVTDTISGMQQTLTVTNRDYFYPVATAVFSAQSFPATHLNQSSTVTVTATQAYGDPLLFGFLSGSSPEISISGPTSCPRNASPCQTQLTFTPTVAGPAYATLIVTDAISGSPNNLYISGVGGIAAYSAPAMYDFGPVKIGVPASTTLQVTNGGDGSGVCPTFALSGTAASDYTLTQSAAGSALAPGGMCGVGVSITANGTGARPATLTATTSAGTMLTISLTANASF